MALRGHMWDWRTFPMGFPRQAKVIHLMQLEEYKSKFADDSSPGWDALNTPLQDVYDEQGPKHWGTILSHMLGGPDPLDGVSAYSCDGEIDHLHFVTFGYSSLYYDEESVGNDFLDWKRLL